jgi:uncharacterized membrane protein YraQ (UPF0718 family)
MAVVRPIAAISSGILSGLLVGNADKDPAIRQKDDKAIQSCCSKKTKPEPVSKCCGREKVKPTSTWQKKMADGLRFSFNDMLRDIALWLIIGLLFAAAVKTWVPSSFLSQWGDGWLAFTVMALIGVPMYICATASTPIAAGLLLSGVSPGAVLVFMMAGPATNIGTLGIIGKEMGTKTLVAYLSGVLIASFVFGYLTNQLVEFAGIDVLSQAGHAHGEHPSLTGIIAALALAALLVRSLWQSYGTRLLPKKAAEPAEDNGMTSRHPRSDKTCFRFCRISFNL